MIEKERFRKAICWLEENAGVPRRVMGEATWIADIYRLRRENKPDVWYCADELQQFGPNGPVGIGLGRMGGHAVGDEE